jgi:hypothetical protein
MSEEQLGVEYPAAKTYVMNAQLSIPPRPAGWMTLFTGTTFAVYKKPNKFHLWMAKVLLGWTFKEAE